MKPIFRVAAAALFVTAIVAVFGFTQGGTKSGSVVKVKARLENVAPGKDVVVLSFDVQKTWHLYANPVDNEDLASSQTTVKIIGKTNPKAVKVDYPVGKPYVQMGEKLKVYEGQFEIRATVERDADAKGPLEAVVQISACNKDSCLIPEKLRIQIP